jgi:hypothetical protein
VRETATTVESTATAVEAAAAPREHFDRWKDERRRGNNTEGEYFVVHGFILG